ncbi:MAG TPA: hypothetical protein VK304_14960 [Thermoleophilaceae bacterium]|nr:hypothetical protein [Thermoleophilaceae bacterium]
MKKKSAAVLSICALALTAAAPAFADQNEGPGNGAGQSKQCTGPQADRPSSCTSQGGPGDQGSN